VGGQCHAPAALPLKDPIPILYKAGWAPVSVRMGTENLSPTGIRSPDRASRSESLYQLSYPGPYSVTYLRQPSTVEPQFTNASVHEQIFRAKNVSDDEHASWQQRQAESIGAGVSVAG
jgi:hypothetical protein